MVWSSLAARVHAGHREVIAIDPVLSPQKPNRYKDAVKLSRGYHEPDLLQHFVLYQNSVEDLLEAEMLRDMTHEMNIVNSGLRLQIAAGEYMFTDHPQLASTREKVREEYAALLDLRSWVYDRVRANDPIANPSMRLKKMNAKLYGILRGTVTDAEMLASIADVRMQPMNGIQAW